MFKEKKIHKLPSPNVDLPCSYQFLSSMTAELMILKWPPLHCLKSP